LAKNYGEFEEGNQLSFTQFQDYINVNYPPEQQKSVFDEIVPKMKHMILKTIMAVRKKLDPN
jgi:hypothetical protein